MCFNVLNTMHYMNELVQGVFGRFPFDQKFRFEISGIPCDEWNGISRLAEPTRPRPSLSKFRAKIQTVKQGENIKMADSVLLLLELVDDSEVEYNEILSIEDDSIFSA